ncbi:MAG: hypothetical protein Q8784_01215 [Vigna little leaf phytoplasma]|nr:hypothetical protein [Vigna little leaf phytoplasma]
MFNDWHIILIFIILTFLFFMLEHLFYKRKQNSKIIEFLLKCNTLEQEVLKTILKNKEKEFPLTKDSVVTQKFVNFNILSKLRDDPKNPLHGIYLLNSKVFDLIHNNIKLKQIYL